MASPLPSAPPPSSKRRRLSSATCSSPHPPPPPPCQPLGLFYLLGPELGRGQFGTIRLCTHNTSHLFFAWKSIPKSSLSSPQDYSDVLSEIRTMQLLSRHPHVVRLHHAFEDRTSFHLVMELCAGGELFNRIVKKARYSETDAAPIIKTLVETIDFLHRRGVIHRDIKPENILFADTSDSADIKLADFGLALRFSPGEKFSGVAGTPCYVAPEMLQGEYSEEIDIWSAGVLLYVLLSGEFPFSAEDERGIFKAIKKAELHFQEDHWGKVSSSAKDLIRGMLCPHVKSRLTPSQILEHPWVRSHTPSRQQFQKPAQTIAHERACTKSDVYLARISAPYRTDRVTQAAF